MNTKAFINEFHYDNASNDVGEFVEILLIETDNLDGWMLTLYNGSNGSAYDTIDLTGVTVTDLGNGFGTIVIDFPSNGIQNGGPDGISLSDDQGNLVQFISYEGTFTGSGGAADGITSTDIGVAETSSTPIGTSLQLTGTGSAVEDFTWTAGSSETKNAANEGQTLTADNGGETTVFISEIHYDNASTDVGEFIEVTGTAGADLTGYSLVLYNGSNGTAYNTVNLSGTIDDEA
ncbi:MAG: endonuclease, partial [Cyanobacteria bacterium J06632_22]